MALAKSHTRGAAPNPTGAVPTVDPAAMPDFIPATDRDSDTQVGWVRSVDVLDPTLPQAGPDAQGIAFEARRIPVYADDLKTVVGHMVDGRGFQKLGSPLPQPFPLTERQSSLAQ